MRPNTPPIALLFTLLFTLGGCASKPTPATIAIEPGAYPRVFDAAREVLLAQDFELERVDAASGILSTVPKGSAGLATPWISDAGSLAEQVQDLGASHWRVARVTFQPAAPTDRPPIGTPGSGFSDLPDLRQSDQPLEAVVQVFVYERYKPNRRLETESIRRSTFFTDPDLLARGIQPNHLTPLRQDPGLASTLADRIRRRLR